jgi:hypothetical protein
LCVVNDEELTLNVIPPIDPVNWYEIGNVESNSLLHLNVTPDWPAVITPNGIICGCGGQTGTIHHTAHKLGMIATPLAII